MPRPTQEMPMHKTILGSQPYAETHNEGFQEQFASASSNVPGNTMVPWQSDPTQERQHNGSLAVRPNTEKAHSTFSAPESHEDVSVMYQTIAQAVFHPHV